MSFRRLHTCRICVALRGRSEPAQVNKKKMYAQENSTLRMPVIFRENAVLPPPCCPDFYLEYMNI
jgi:hypothetical protein